MSASVPIAKSNPNILSVPHPRSNPVTGSEPFTSSNPSWISVFELKNFLYNKVKEGENKYMPYEISNPEVGSEP